MFFFIPKIVAALSLSFALSGAEKLAVSNSQVSSPIPGRHGGCVDTGPDILPRVRLSASDSQLSAG